MLKKYGPEIVDQLAALLSAKLNKESLKTVLDASSYEKLLKSADGNNLSLPVLYQQLDKATASRALTGLLQKELDKKESPFQRRADPATKNLASRLIGDIFQSFSKDGAGANGRAGCCQQATTGFHHSLCELITHPSFDRLMALRCCHKRPRDEDDGEEPKKRLRPAAIHIEPRVHQLCHLVRQSIINSTLIQTYLGKRAQHAELLAEAAWDQASVVIHLLHFFKLYAQSTIGSKAAVPCELCCEATTEKRASEIFFELWNERDELANLLNVYYECDLTTAKEFIQLIKPPCFPYKGTFPWCMNIYIAELFRRENNFRDFWPVAYHGVLYRSSNEAALACSADQIISRALAPGNPISRHAFLYAVGDIFKPQHWCGIFIDIAGRQAFFYNSLAKPAQVNWQIVDVYNNMCVSRGLASMTIRDYITNEIKLQGDSSLCGHFVYDFFREMLKQPSEQLKEMFLDYARPPEPGTLLDAALRDKVSNDFRFSSDRISLFTSKFALGNN